MKNLLMEIKNSLYEEMGISKEVTNISNDILSSIIKDSKTIPYNDIKKHNFIYEYNGNKIYVDYTLYYVLDEDSINTVIKHDNINTFGESDRKSKNIYYLKTTVFYQRDINKYVDYNGTIQHEFEHIYQMIKSGKHLLSNVITKDIYTTADYLRHKSDIISKLIGYTIYYNNRFEQDAFANGLYKKIMDNPTRNPYDILQQDVTYKNVLTIKKYILENNTYQTTIDTVVQKQFNKTYKWFHKIAENMVKTYIRKMSRTLLKAQNDKKTSPLDGDNMYETIEN